VDPATLRVLVVLALVTVVLVAFPSALRMGLAG
jgi:hypothetical protein